MPTNRPTGLTRASAEAVSSAKLRCGAITTQPHGDVTIPTAEDDVLKGCEPRRNREPVYLSFLGILLALACAFWGATVLP